LPVPGGGTYEWAGYLKAEQMPSALNPPAHFLATANHNILPAGYSHGLAYEWAPRFRYDRIRELLAAAGRKITVQDFQRMQYDVLSLPARRFQAVLRKWLPGARGRHRQMADLLIAWDCRLGAASPEALLYEIWFSRLPQALFGPALGLRVDLQTVLRELETTDRRREIESALEAALRDLDRHIGSHPANWFWGRVQVVRFVHPLNASGWSVGPLAAGGDGFTVQALGGGGSGHVSSGASYRQILDLADWDRSVMTNVPGESGDPRSPHYRDLVEAWSKGQYHPMPFSRGAVEAAATERILLRP
jgi:penicillin amidase